VFEKKKSESRASRFILNSPKLIKYALEVSKEKVLVDFFIKFCEVIQYKKFKFSLVLILFSFIENVKSFVKKLILEKFLFK
jgi:hypothetical protein